MALCRTTLYARKKKAEIFALLGKKCVLCGEDNEDFLEFDHINGRDYNPNELSYGQRLTRYYREAKKGLLRVLCADCNKAVRKRYENGAYCRTEHEPARTIEMPEIVDVEL